MEGFVCFQDVCKYYQMGDTLVKAADHISMKIERGEFVAIVGQSGSGKSTCMNIIGCLDIPTHGRYLLDGSDVGKMNRRELAAIRNEKLGFIFQQYNLLPKLTLLENVEVPLIYAGVGGSERRSRAIAALEQVGLGSKLRNKPNQLSGGQQQRVSIARALVRNPPIILADEPVASLDPITAKQVMEDFVRINKEYNISILLNIHHVDLALKYCDRVIGVRAGEIVFDGPASTITQEQIDAVYNGAKVPTMGDGE